MKNVVLRQGLNVLAVLATIIVNGMANALPLNGQMTGAISDRFQVYFVPAGYVFSIWGVIYLGLLAYAVYQALPGQRANPRLRSIDLWFVLSCAANVAWLFLWHYERFPLTLLAMLALLGSLIVIYLRLQIGRTSVSTGENWLVRLPFSVYLGWVTVATIANVTSLLDYLAWNGWGLSDAAWAVIMLSAGTLVAAAMTLTRRDAAYLLVLVWAYIGIAVRHAGAAPVALAAWINTALILGLFAWAAWSSRRAPSAALSDKSRTV